MRGLCTERVKIKASASVCSMAHTAWMLDSSLVGLTDGASISVGAVSAPDLAGVWSQGKYRHHHPWSVSPASLAQTCVFQLCLIETLEHVICQMRLLVLPTLSSKRREQCKQLQEGLRVARLT